MRILGTSHHLHPKQSAKKMDRRLQNYARSNRRGGRDLAGGGVGKEGEEVEDSSVIPETLPGAQWFQKGHQTRPLFDESFKNKIKNQTGMARETSHGTARLTKVKIDAQIMARRDAAVGGDKVWVEPKPSTCTLLDPVDPQTP